MSVSSAMNLGQNFLSISLHVKCCTVVFIDRSIQFTYLLCNENIFSYENARFCYISYVNAIFAILEAVGSVRWGGQDFLAVGGLEVEKTAPCRRPNH